MEKIKELQKRIDDLQKEIDNYEIDPDDYATDYDDMLDCEGDVKVCGLTFSPSRIIKELDPTAYHCGLLDYVDSVEKEYDYTYKTMLDEMEALENELDDLVFELENN